MDENIFKLLNTDFIFSKPQDEKVDFVESDLIELKPYGLSISNETTRPFMIFKDDKGEYTLPVGISQIEAGVALTQSNTMSAPVSPHKFSKLLLESLDIEIERCIFTEIKGLHQYVRVYFKGHPKYHSMKLKAEEAMSLCIYLKVPVYATKSFIQKSKLMTAEVSGLAKTMQGRLDVISSKKELCH